MRINPSAWLISAAAIVLTGYSWIYYDPPACDFFFWMLGLCK
jgi:hypothetical protein